MAKNKPATERPKTTNPSTQPATERTRFFTASFWRNHWIPAVLLVLSSVFLYQKSGSFGYILDDEMVIWKNAYVQKGISGIGKIFGTDSFMGYFQKKEDLFKVEGGRYRPLSLATFATEISLLGKPASDAPMEKAGESSNEVKNYGRGNPQLSHWVNIFLYGLSGILLYLVLLGLFPLADNQKWWWSVPFAGALLFVFHPIHTECIANIKGRDEILALMGSLGALWASMKYFDTRKSQWYWMSGALFLLGLFSKENTLTFLAVIPLTIWFFGRISFGQAIRGAVPLALAAFVFILVRYQALGYMVSHGKPSNDLMNNSFVGMNWGEKMATIFVTLGWYVKLLFYPHPLTHDYYPYHVPKANWTNPEALLYLAAYAGAIFWSVKNLKKRKVAAYCTLFFIITLSIVSNLVVPVGSFMNERFAYMPSVAWAIFAAWGLTSGLPGLFPKYEKELQYAGMGVLALVLGLFAWRTLVRIPAWENTFALNESAVIASPNSARAQSFYATALYQERYIKSKDKEEKMRLVDTMEYHVKRALEIHPEYGAAWVMYANVALARFEGTIKMDRLFNDLGYALEKSPYNGLMRANIERYLQYLATKGGNPNKICSFAYRVGYEHYFKKLKDIKSAITYLNFGVLTNSADERLLNALAEVYDAARQPEMAAEMRKKAETAAHYYDTEVKE